MKQTATFNTITGSDWALALCSARKRRITQRNALSAFIQQHMRTNISPASIAKWTPYREKCIKALLAGWSVHAITRAYEVPDYMVSHWRAEEAIPPYTGPKKPTPEVGQVLA